MKSLTVQLADDLYERAESCAALRGASLPKEVADFLKRYVEGTPPAPAAKTADVTPPDLGRLLAALDAGHNVATVGALQRAELYDRPALH